MASKNKCSLSPSILLCLCLIGLVACSGGGSSEGGDDCPFEAAPDGSCYSDPNCNDPEYADHVWCNWPDASDGADTDVADADGVWGGTCESTDTSELEGRYILSTQRYLSDRDPPADELDPFYSMSANVIRKSDGTFYMRMQALTQEECPYPDTVEERCDDFEPRTGIGGFYAVDDIEPDADNRFRIEIDDVWLSDWALPSDYHYSSYYGARARFELYPCSSGAFCGTGSIEFVDYDVGIAVTVTAGAVRTDAALNTTSEALPTTCEETAELR